MKLYTIQIGVIKTAYPQNSYLARFDLVLEGDDPSDDEGDWSVPAWATNFLGRTDGYWRVSKNRDGDKELGLMEADDPNMISWLWRSMPQGVAVLEGVLKLPFFSGETGTGVLMPVGKPGATMTWRVTNRGF